VSFTLDLNGLLDKKETVHIAMIGCLDGALKSFVFMFLRAAHESNCHELTAADKVAFGLGRTSAIIHWVSFSRWQRCHQGSCPKALAESWQH
jgi:hypothetical protein